MMKKDHFKQKLLLWPPVPYKQINLLLCALKSSLSRTWKSKFVEIRLILEAKIEDDS